MDVFKGRLGTILFLAKHLVNMGMTFHTKDRVTTLDGHESGCFHRCPVTQWKSVLPTPEGKNVRRKWMKPYLVCLQVSMEFSSVPSSWDGCDERRTGHVLVSGKVPCEHGGSLEGRMCRNEMDDIVPAHCSDFYGVLLGCHLSGMDVMRRGLGTLYFLAKHLVNTVEVWTAHT